MDFNGTNHLTAVRRNIALKERYNWGIYNLSQIQQQLRNSQAFDNLKLQILGHFEEVYSEHPQRIDIQRRLKDYQIGNVFSTSALELGIDYSGVNIICNVGAINPLSAIQRKGRAGRDKRTCYSVLHIMLVRNNPIELYYASNPDALLDPFQHDLPVALENPAVLERNILMCCLDYLAQQGQDTYAMGSPLNSIPAMQRFLGNLSNLIKDHNFDNFLRDIFEKKT